MKLRNQSCQLILGHYKLILGHYSIKGCYIHYQSMVMLLPNFGNVITKSG